MFIAADLAVSWFSSTMDRQRRLDLPVRIQITHMPIAQPFGVGFGRQCSCVGFAALRGRSFGSRPHSRSKAPGMGVALERLLAKFAHKKSYLEQSSLTQFTKYDLQRQFPKKNFQGD